MKRMARISVALMGAGLFCGGALFVGCSDEKTTTDGGGPDGSTTTDTGTGQDGNKPDTSTQDTGTQDTGATDGGVKDGSSDGSMMYALTCQSYCTGMLSVCTGGMNGQYLDMATCMSMCAKFTVGDAGASMGDTLACRVYHLTVASQNQMQADTHCPHAGPFGYAQCGTECETFCALYAAQCGNTWGGNCAQACPGINNPVNTTTSFLSGSGNTLDCRQYHLENAYQANNMNGAGHCAHATSGGGGVCQ